MHTRIRERPAPAVAGSLAVAGGLALWQLGIEFERAWLRSDAGPLMGETPPEVVAAVDRADGERSTKASGGRRRWVASHHPRSLPHTRNGTSSGGS